MNRLDVDDWIGRAAQAVDRLRRRDPGPGRQPRSPLNRWPVMLALVVVLGLGVLMAFGRPGAASVSHWAIASLSSAASQVTTTQVSGIPAVRSNPGQQLDPALAGGEIKVAILAPLTGVAPAFGAATRNGALLAINQWNARGGVLGRRILPVVEDSQCAANGAASAAHTVIDQDKVHYIIGEVCSRASVAISDIANQAGVVQITPTSTEQKVTVDQAGQVKDYIFRACFIDPFQGAAAARFAVKDLRARTAVILSNQADSYSKGLSDYFAKTFSASGGVVLARETYTSQTTDFAPIMDRVAGLHPDVVYLPDYYKVANLASRQAKESHVTAPLIGGDGWDSPDLDRAATAGDYFTTHYSSADPRPAVQDFVKEYEAAYPGSTPDSLAALAYDATNLMLEGIKEAGADDAGKVKDALADIQFEAVSGNIRFDSQHDPLKPAAVMNVTAGGVAFKDLVNP